MCLFLFSTCFGRLCAHHQEKHLCLFDTWYLLFCMDDCLVSTLHTRHSTIQNNRYQVSHKYSCFSWWWAHRRPKHVEKRNKHTKKNFAPSWLYLQDYAGMHGQQNTKKKEKMSVSVYQLTWCNIPEDLRLQHHCYENVKWRITDLSEGGLVWWCVRTFLPVR
jgi:hypothetical protein